MCEPSCNSGKPIQQNTLSRDIKLQTERKIERMIVSKFIEIIRIATLLLLFSAVDNIYKARYERTVRETEISRKRQEKVHEEEIEELTAFKKQVERKVIARFSFIHLNIFWIVQFLTYLYDCILACAMT